MLVFFTEDLIKIINENGIILNVSSKMGSLDVCELTCYEIGCSKYFNKNYSFKIQASYRFIDNAKLRLQNYEGTDYERSEFDASENIFYLMVQIAF
jgi:hypothetical protein